MSISFANLAVTLKRYAMLFYKTNRLREAEVAYWNAAAIFRDLIAKEDPAGCQGCLAQTLTSLAEIYHDTHRSDEEKAAKQEALTLRAKLTAQNKNQN